MNCYLCGNVDHKLIHVGVRGNKNVNVYRCSNCGLVFLSSAIENIEEFYEESGMWNCSNDRNISEIRKMTYTDDNRRFYYVRSIIENRRCLDFGCGAGGFLSMAQSVASSAEGIELEKRMRTSLNKEGIKCYENIDEISKVGGVYDVITMFHVLEHLPNPIDVLQSMRELLSEQGRIIIEVPNAEDALLSLYESKDFADFTYWVCHLFLFNNSTIKTVAKRAGLNISFLTQIQRYPLSNHLYWLSKGSPGGHQKWSSLCDDRLDRLYGDMLAKHGIADTLFVEMTKE